MTLPINQWKCEWNRSPNTRFLISQTAVRFIACGNNGLEGSAALHKCLYLKSAEFLFGRDSWTCSRQPQHFITNDDFSSFWPLWFAHRGRTWDDGEDRERPPKVVGKKGGEKKTGRAIWTSSYQAGPHVPAFSPAQTENHSSCTRGMTWW